MPAALRLDCAAEPLSFPRSCPGSQDIARSAGKAARSHVPSLERSRGSAGAAGMAPGRGNRHEVGPPLLGHFELRPAQRGAPWLRRALAGLALLQCSSVSRRSRSRRSGATLARLSASRLRKRLGPARLVTLQFALESRL